MKIGVLAVQGAFIEHEHMLEKLGIPCVEIRKKEDLSGIDGIILPGGESTVQGQLLNKLDMKETLRDMIINGLPALATCAGLILLAENIGEKEAPHLGTMPVSVRRNAYGRQLSSFMTTAAIDGIGNYPMVFIRARILQELQKMLSLMPLHLLILLMIWSRLKIPLFQRKVSKSCPNWTDTLLQPNIKTRLDWLFIRK